MRPRPGRHQGLDEDQQAVASGLPACVLPSPVRLSIVQPLLEPVHGDAQRFSLALRAGRADAGFFAVPSSLIQLKPEPIAPFVGLAEPGQSGDLPRLGRIRPEALATEMLL